MRELELADLISYDPACGGHRRALAITSNFGEVLSPTVTSRSSRHYASFMIVHQPVGALGAEVR
jgi:hypothetical protein